MRSCEARSRRLVLIFSEEVDFRKIQDFGEPFLLPETVKVQNGRPTRNFCVFRLKIGPDGWRGAEFGAFDTEISRRIQRRNGHGVNLFKKPKIIFSGLPFLGPETVEVNK